MSLLEIESEEESVIEISNVPRRPMEALDGLYSLIESLERVTINNTIFYNTDLRLLQPGKWLNDKVINAYFELLADYNKNAFYFTTHLFPMLQSMSMRELARRYSAVDFSRYTCFFIPINLSSHWSLVRIEGNMLMGFDSIGEVPCKLIFLVRNFYSAVVLKRDELRTAFMMRLTDGKIPKQANGDDCGVFCCQYAKRYVVTENYRTFSAEDILKIRKQMLHEILAGRILYP